MKKYSNFASTLESLRAIENKKKKKPQYSSLFALALISLAAIEESKKKKKQIIQK